MVGIVLVLPGRCFVQQLVQPVILLNVDMVILHQMTLEVREYRAGRYCGEEEEKKEKAHRTDQMVVNLLRGLL